jgi:iron complex outermembrane recepter protein
MNFKSQRKQALRITEYQQPVAQPLIPFSKVLIGIALANLSWSGLVLAQSTLPAVIVVGQPDYAPDAGLATKTDTPAREVPFATSTVGRTLLQDRGVTSMNDALRTVPGVTAINGIGNVNARYRFRGFLATSQLKDGFRQQVNFPVTEFQNVESLEVMRGPASALYGRFEPGGVLNIVTKRPGVEIREVGYGLGSDGQRRATADFGGKANDFFSYRVNAVIESSDTFRDFVDNKTTFFAPSVRFRFTAQTTLDVNAEWLKRDTVFDRGLPLALNVPILSLPAKRFLGDPSDTFDNSSRAFNAMLTHKFAGETIFKLGFAQNRAQSDGTYFFPIGTTPLISNAGVLSRRNQVTSDLNKDATLSAEIAGKFNLGSMQHKWLAGFEHNTSVEDSSINRATVNALLNIYDPVYIAVRSPATAAIISSVARNTTTALILQDEISFNPYWRLTVGLRSEKIKSSFADRITNITRQSDVQATTWRAGLAWMPTPETVAFANYSQSFSPEVTSRGLVGGAAPEPSRGKQFEFGGRMGFFDNRLQTTATVFDIKRTNVRVAEPLPSALDRQVGEQRSKGFEFELAGRPTNAWQIVASFTTLDAKVTKDSAALVGKQFNGVPRNIASLWNRYDFNAMIGVGAGLTYTGARFVDPANTLSLPAYTRWDLAAYGQITREVRWQVNLLNAFNKKYFDSGNTTGNFYPGQPRTLRASLNLKF